MRPAKDAGRPSCLAINPKNREASAARRTRLLAAFDSLDEDTRADLLEAAETIAFRQSGGVDFERDDVRDIIRQAYEAAGWEHAPGHHDGKPWFTGTEDELSEPDRILIRSGATLAPGGSMGLPGGWRISYEKWVELGGATQQPEDAEAADSFGLTHGYWPDPE